MSVRAEPLQKATHRACCSDELTLSIVSHGHGALLERLLRDLAALPTAGRAHLIVTLNKEGEEFDAKKFAPLRIAVIRNASPAGFGANHNAAFRQCKTPWFAILNPDLRLPSDPFPFLLAAADRTPGVGLIAPQVVGPSGAAEDSIRPNLTPGSLLRRRLFNQREVLRVKGSSQCSQRFYWVAGMFMLVRASAFRAVRGFDPRFFMYCEDYDLCARLHVAGYSVNVAPEAIVVHEAQRDSHRYSIHLRWHLTSLLKVWLSAAYWRVTLGLGVQRSPESCPGDEHP